MLQALELTLDNNPYFPSSFNLSVLLDDLDIIKAFNSLCRN